MKPGDKLNNGALILAMKGNIALCLWGGEYVIWSVMDNGEAHTGSYFRPEGDDMYGAYLAASKAFEAR